MDKLNLKFLTVRILELDSGCYGGCPLLDTSMVMGDASLNYFDAHFRHAVCVSVHCTRWEQCIQRAFPPDLKPARQLSTCNQWGGIPYRRHFRKEIRYCKSTNFGVLLYLANLANCVFSLIFVPANIYVDRTLHRWAAGRRQI